jgi:hypothetical protein
MRLDAKPDAAEILAALQRGEIPPLLRPDVRAIWRGTSGRALIAYTVLTILLWLALPGPWLAIGIRSGDAGVIVFSGLIALVFGLPLVIVVIIHLRRRYALLADLEVGRVQQAEGEILMRGHNNQPRFVWQHKWSSSFYDYNKVAPGKYRFYFLPHSGFVLLIVPLLAKK